MKRELKVRCLVLDHDDTVVRSSPEIHYPSFCRALKKLRPEMELSYEQFIAWNFIPGFTAMCYEILGFSEEEMAYQEQCWREGASKKIPEMYEGMRELLMNYLENGGRVCVSSHSAKAHIMRDYKAAGVPVPEYIFDWECARKKPDPFALEEIMRIYGLEPEELLMVDDLKPGYDMAKAVGVPFACAGWSDNQIPVIRSFMQEHCTNYVKRVTDLENLLYKK